MQVGLLLLISGTMLKPFDSMGGCTHCYVCILLHNLKLCDGGAGRAAAADLSDMSKAIQQRG